VSDLRPQPLGSGVRDPVPGEKIGDYEVIGPIARGGMATVLAVRDLRTNKRLGLKLLLPFKQYRQEGGPSERNEETQSRFRREFRALSRLHHPNVLRVYEWGLYGDRPWYTMDLITGHDLRVEAERLQALPPEERYARIGDILRQAARALAYIHERGLVHRDVTPGNLMISTDGAVKIMDFGVVKETDTELTGVGELIGTVAYMAPEQISGEAVDPRTDLYSLGAVLYLMCTGKRPFSAHTIHGFMEKHLNTRPRPPHELEPTVPEWLEEICLRLLEKAPGDRFASAHHLLHVLGDKSSGEDLEGRWPPFTVGRTSVRARIQDAIEDLASGRPGQVILLSGQIGLGKSRLLELAEQQARRRGLPVAIGRCRLQDRPFGAFATIYRAIRTAEAPALLEQVFRGDEGSRIERYPVLAAFRELVVAKAPIVLLVDDVDRADPATTELLVYLIRNTLELAHESVLFVLTHGGEDARILAQLESLPPVEPFELTPLDAAEVEELVVSILGNEPAVLGLAERLAREGDGTPAFVADMLRGLLDDGLIVQERTGAWRLTADAAQITQSRLPMPASLRQALQDRISPLPPDAIGVARVLAVARRRIDFDVLVEATRFEGRVDEERVIEALDELADAELVDEHRSADQEAIELAQGRFREVLLENVSPHELQDLHRRLGEAIERHHRAQLGTVVEELAYHFEYASLWTKAYRYFVWSAQRHLQRSLFQESLGLLERALHLEPKARVWLTLDDADRQLAEVWLATSRARHGLGQLEAAVDATTEAQRLAKLVRDPKLESNVATELGTQLRQQGRSEEAEVQLQVAVKGAEEAGDQTLLPAPLYELGGSRWSRGDLAGAEQHWRRSLQLAQQVGDERAQGRGYNGLAVLAICRGQSLEARRLLEQSVTVFERLGMLAPLVVARANLIELYTNTGILRKALSLADRTVSQAEEASFPQGIALGKGWRARVLVILGRVEEAEREAGEALTVIRRLGIRDDEVTILYALAEVAMARGQPAAIERATRQLVEALEIQDTEGTLSEARALRATALVALGRTAEARSLLAEACPRSELWPHVQVRVDLALGRALGALGERPAAQQKLQRAQAVSEANGFRTFQLAAHTASLEVVEDPSVRARHLRIAAGLARSLAANLPKDEADRFLAHHGIT
jgi:serine/threonine protein kinase/tetratricopeptide (TPR) repeat protein